MELTRLSPVACTINVFTIVIYDLNDSGQYYWNNIQSDINDEF
jgi:hypothetical protein